jgi:hypothetical protein
MIIFKYKNKVKGIKYWFNFRYVSNWLVSGDL